MGYRKRRVYKKDMLMDFLKGWRRESLKRIDVY